MAQPKQISDLPSTTPAATDLIAFQGASGARNTYIGNLSQAIMVTQGGSGAVNRTILDWSQDTVSVTDYGAVGDGVTDDTAAITNAIAALTAGGDLHYSGTPLISSKITIDKRIRLIADGALGNTSQAPTSYFIKKSTMTTAAVEITAVGVEMIGGGVIGQGGNTGDGIHVLARGVHLDGVYVYGMGNDGFSVGAPAAGTDANYWRFDGCQAYQNGRDGFHFESTTPNANAGTAIACVADENTRDGYRVAKAYTCQFINCNGSGNDGWGFYNDIAEYTVLSGGDYESNTADGTNQIYNSANATFFGVMGLRPEFKIKDESYTKANQPFNLLTKRLDKFVYMDMDLQLILCGSATAAKAISSISRSTTTVTLNITGHGFAVGEGFAVEDTGTLFDGGYIVASTPTADQITATVSSDRAGKLPVSWSGAASAYLGYDVTSVGHWTRMGDVVFIQGYVLADGVALDGTVTGNSIIRGLPYPAENTANKFAGISCVPTLVEYPATTTEIAVYSVPNAYYLSVVGAGDGVSLQLVPVGATGMTIASSMVIGGHYRATPYTV